MSFKESRDAWSMTPPPPKEPAGWPKPTYTEQEKTILAHGNYASWPAWLAASQTFYHQKPAKYKGFQLMSIAQTAEGLKFLYWLRAKMDARGESTKLAQAIYIFLADERLRHAHLFLEARPNG